MKCEWCRLCCHGVPWGRTEESPVEVRFAGVSRSVDHPTLSCLLWLGDNGPLLREWDTQPEPDTGSSQCYTKQSAELWHFPPSRKTISTVIKGELNRLISSKVTEEPPLSTLPSPPPFLLPSSFSLSLHSQSPREVEAINEMPSDLWGVRGHRTKMLRWTCSLAAWKERLCVLSRSDRWIEGSSGNTRHCAQANHFA